MQICELVSLKIALRIRVTPDWKLAGGELPPLMAAGGQVPLSEQRPRVADCVLCFAGLGASLEQEGRLQAECWGSST